MAASAATKMVTFKLPEGSENGAAESAAHAVLPKTPHPRKLRPAESAQQTLAPAPASSDVSHSHSDSSNATPKGAPLQEEIQKRRSRPPSRPASERDSSLISASSGAARSTHPSTNNNVNTPPKLKTEEVRPPSRPASEHDAYVKRKTGHLSDDACRRARSALYREQKEQQRIRPSDTAHAMNAVKERTNSASREHISSMKYNVAKLRERLLRMEEEIRQSTRGKNTLELAVQDVRRAMSVNQQSVSMQQKRSRAERDSTLTVLREESRVLSQSKNKVEQLLRSVRSNLQTLDNVRRSIRGKISSLSQALYLDAQSFKLRCGKKHYRMYVSECAAPQLRDHPTYFQDNIAPLCSRSVEIISASKRLRGQIEGLIVSIQTHIMQVHSQVTSALSQRLQEANSKKCEMLLEKGQMRLSQNSTHHQQHHEEITLGRVLGPVLDKYRSVSEKEDRPLSRLRPGSAMEEKADIRRTSAKLAKQLSASSVRTARMQSAEQQLQRQLRQQTLSASLDSQILRVRKMSLDNRWVQ